MPELTKPNLGSEPSIMHPSMDGRVLSLDVLGPLDLHDYSKQIRDGLITNNGAIHADGQYGPALLLPETTGYISIDVTTGQSFTIVLPYSGILSSWNDLVQTGADDGLMVTTDTPYWRGGSGFQPFGSILKNNGQVNYFVIVSDGSGIIKAYVDGDYRASVNDTNLPATFNWGRIGYWNEASSDITVYSTSIFNYALSAQEIKALYDNPWAAYRDNSNILFMPQGGVTPPTGFKPYWARNANNLIGAA
jgi:hypothetical protein